MSKENLKIFIYNKEIRLCEWKGKMCSDAENKDFVAKEVTHLSCVHSSHF